jgi:two-component system, OmpR family, response regulator
MATDAARRGEEPHLALVIDDDAKMRHFIETTLTQLGVRVAAFQTAPEALAALDAGYPAVIFLDVALLRSDAIDVLRGLGERRYGGLVQLMSGGRPLLLEAIQRIGVRHGIRLAPPLNKPFAREAIGQLIENLPSLSSPPQAAPAVVAHRLP